MIAAKDPATELRDDIRGYVAGVRSGEIVAGKLVKLAVERYVADHEHAHERGWKFDADVATRACCFFPLCLRHSQGAYAGEPFYLSPWQNFIVWNLCGWVSIQTGLRRFRKSLIEIARKNGKTTFAAGLALRAMYFDEPREPGAQVYCAATKEEQAKLLYSEAVRMVKQCDWLKGITKVRRAPHMLEYQQFDSYFRPLGSDGDSTDGLNPHCIIRDELHAWRERHRPFAEKLSTGFGSRRQPLELSITTAGDADSQLWIEEHEYAERVMEASAVGNVIDDSYFAFLACIDEDDDPFDEDCWAKANPNLGVSVDAGYLRTQANEAAHKPTATNQFIRYFCNRKTEATERSFSPEAWAAGGSPVVLERNAYGHGGIDLGRSNDWAAVAMCFPDVTTKDGEERTTWRVKAKAWTCSDGGFAADQQPFAGWIKAGLLECHKGNAIDTEPIEQWIVEQSREYDIKSWAFDKTYARELSQRLQDQHGLSMFEFTQSPRFYNEPFRKFIAELPNGTIVHGSDPVLDWQAANVQTYRNHKDEWMPDKANPKRKIDGVVALLMAFSECLFAASQPTGSLLVT